MLQQCYQWQAEITWRHSKANCELLLFCLIHFFIETVCDRKIIADEVIINVPIIEPRSDKTSRVDGKSIRRTHFSFDDERKEKFSICRYLQHQSDKEMETTTSMLNGLYISQALKWHYMRLGMQSRLCSKVIVRSKESRLLRPMKTRVPMSFSDTNRNLGQRLLILARERGEMFFNQRQLCDPKTWRFSTEGIVSTCSNSSNCFGVSSRELKSTC